MEVALAETMTVVAVAAAKVGAVAQQVGVANRWKMSGAQMGWAY